MTVQPLDMKAVVDGAVVELQPILRRLALITLMNQGKQFFDGFVDVIAIAGFFAGEAHQFQIAQGFQAVATAVGWRLQWHITQVGPGFDIKQE